MVHGSPHVEACRRLRPWSAGEAEQEHTSGPGGQVRVRVWGRPE